MYHMRKIYRRLHIYHHMNLFQPRLRWLDLSHRIKRQNHISHTIRRHNQNAMNLSHTIKRHNQAHNQMQRPPNAHDNFQCQTWPANAMPVQRVFAWSASCTLLHGMGQNVCAWHPVLLYFVFVIFTKLISEKGSGLWPQTPHAMQPFWGCLMHPLPLSASQGNPLSPATAWDAQKRYHLKMNSNQTIIKPYRTWHTHNK